MAGADVFTIQSALGHASVAMSQRYVHPMSDSLKRAVRSMLEFDRKQREV
jgi:site-specific recombinase XerD